MMTFKEYLEHMKVDDMPVQDEKFYDKFYRDMCINCMYKTLDTFRYNLMQNNPTKEELYNWCVTLETIFNIKTK